MFWSGSSTDAFGSELNGEPLQRAQVVGFWQADPRQDVHVSFREGFQSDLILIEFPMIL
jgi:hypothetical protein